MSPSIYRYPREAMDKLLKRAARSASDRLDQNR
jgi:hypothetical protein